MMKKNTPACHHADPLACGVKSSAARAAVSHDVTDAVRIALMSPGSVLPEFHFSQPCASPALRLTSLHRSPLDKPPPLFA